MQEEKPGGSLDKSDKLLVETIACLLTRVYLKRGRSVSLLHVFSLVSPAPAVTRHIIWQFIKLSCEPHPLVAQGPRQACSKGAVSGSGGNFDNLIDQQCIYRFPGCTIVIINMWSNESIKIPTTTSYHPYCTCMVHSGPANLALR